MVFMYVFLFLNSQQAAVLLYKEPDPTFEKRLSKNTFELIFLTTHISNVVPSKAKADAKTIHHFWDLVSSSSEVFKYAFICFKSYLFHLIKNEAVNGVGTV